MTAPAPLCSGTLHDGYSIPADYRYDQHGCDTGFLCVCCVDRSRNKFETAVREHGHTHCGRCETAFDNYDAIVTNTPLREAN